MSTRKRTVKTDYDMENMVLNLSLVDPTTAVDEEGNEKEPEVYRSFSLPFDELPEEMQRRVSLFGYHQLLVQRSGPTGATLEEKAENIEDVSRQLIEGTWSARAIGGGAGPIPLAARALARVKGVPESVAQAKWKSLDKATKETLKANAKIAAAMEEIREESRETPSMDLDDLIAA